MVTRNKNNPQPQQQPTHKQGPSTGRRSFYNEDRKPQTIESVQPPRPQPGKGDKK